MFSLVKIYSPQAATPAAAITLASGNCDSQPVLFTSHFGDTGTYSGCATGPAPTTQIPTTGTTAPPTTTTSPLPAASGQPITLQWSIKSIEVTLTRDWSISQAFIVLTCPITSSSAFLPTLPDVSAYRGGVYPYLSEEDEIRIYAGYVASTTTPITADLLDEIPFTFTDIQSNYQYTQNPAKPLAPIFWGFIDKLDYMGSDQGEQLVISCRDRARVFADTRVVSLQAFTGSTNSDSSSQSGSTDDISSVANGDRANILLGLAAAVTGNPYGSSTPTVSCWKSITQGMIVKGYTFSATDNKQVNISIPTQDPSSWIRTATCRIMNEQSAPRFNIWVERPPIVKGETSSHLQVLNKVPLEIIDYLAKTEERPMDFFASHVNGDFTLGPRVKDESGFQDPLRSYRTYFYRNYPKTITTPPSYNQMVLRIRATRSSIFSFNNFIIIDGANKTSGVSLITSIKQGFSAYPTYLSGRNPSPPCKTQVVYDAGLTSYDNQDAGALLIGLANARIWSRDVEGIQLDLVGDPTLYPSEAIRVYNTYLHDNKTYSIVDSAQYEKDYTAVKQQAPQIAQGTVGQTDNQKANPNPSSATSQWAESVFQSKGIVPTNVANLVIPYYTIRSVQHKLSSEGNIGYVTIVQAVNEI